MPPSEPLRVFISYAHKDGASLAQRLQSDLANRGFDTWLDIDRIGGGAIWSETIEREIDTRQVILALLSPGSYASEICRAEQLRALDRGKRVIPVLAVKGSDRPIYLYATQYRDLTDDGNYAERLGQLLTDIRGDATATLPDTYRTTRVTYLTTPPRVANYLDRPEALRELRNAVFAEDHRQPIALTALAGMGGIGKTVLAKALTDDDVVQRAFPDGIVWITAGKEKKRDFIAEMREVAKALGHDLSGYNTALACENQYRTIIAAKAALIVVDDVWSKGDIEPLLAESPRSRFLFTTRDRSIGRFVSAHEHWADLLDIGQSRELLASWANVQVAELPETAYEVIAECGRLPAALSVVGAMLRGANAAFWKDTLDLLRRADLSAIQEQLPEGQESFFKAVEISFQSLKPELQDRYNALAVLLDDMAAPLSILQTLWNASEAKARRTSRLFVDRSLAQPDPSSEGIRLHDLQLDYIRAQYRDREALDLIRGAVRLSSHVISKDPAQFASQMVGRLLAHQDIPAIKQFTARVVHGTPKPWLRPLQPALDPPGTALVRVLEDHSSLVYAVAVSGDGRRALSASQDWTLKVWDLETGQAPRTLEGYSGPVSGVALTADGRRAIASYDKTLKVWDLETGQALHTLEGHTLEVHGVAVSADGRLAISASQDWTLKVWDLETGRTLRTLEGHSGPVLGVAMSAGGRLAVSASQDRTLKVWDLETGQALHTLEGHWGYYGVAVSADGRRAVSASQGWTLKVWDPETGRTLHTLGHAGSVTGVAVSADGRRAVSASWDHTLKVWDLETAQALQTPEGHSSSVTGMAVSADGQRAVSASFDHTLKMWDVGTGRALRTLEGHSDSVYGVAVSADGRRAVSAAYDNTLMVWDLETGRTLHTLGHSGPVYGVAVSADGRRAVSAPEHKTLKVWNLETGRAMRTLKGHSARVYGVALTADGRAVSASEDKTLRVWDVETGRTMRTLKGHSGPVHGVAVSADGRRAISASRDKTLKVWDLETGRTLRTLEGHTDWVYAVAVTADGRRAVSASDDKTLKVWDLGTGAPLAIFTCDAAVHSCALIGNDGLIAGDTVGRIHFLSLEEPKRKGPNTPS